jgi:hypothetical protein
MGCRGASWLQTLQGRPYFRCPLPGGSHLRPAHRLRLRRVGRRQRARLHGHELVRRCCAILLLLLVMRLRLARRVRNKVVGAIGWGGRRDWRGSGGNGGNSRQRRAALLLGRALERLVYLCCSQALALQKRALCCNRARADLAGVTGHGGGRSRASVVLRCRHVHLRSMHGRGHLSDLRAPPTRATQSDCKAREHRDHIMLHYVQ